MRAVIQRVTEARVDIPAEQYRASISLGFVILLGIEDSDDKTDVDWLAKKISAMRVFSDDEGRMNLALQDVGGQVLVISQFTLHASTKKGNRPSFIKAARPEIASELYEDFVTAMESYGVHVATGMFAADMKITLVNDGPVTIIIDSKTKE